MKQLTYVSSNVLLGDHLKEHYDIITDMEILGECVFIDWWPPNSSVSLERVNVLEKAVQRQCKIAIFDRYCSLKLHEVHWLQRYKNVTLFEPCLVTRPGFIYLPFWYECGNVDLIIKEQ